MNYSPEHEEWRKIRLPNWGRAIYVGLMEGRPDSSCANSFWDQMIPDDGSDGYGEIDGNTVLAPQYVPARAELPDIDHEDAEVVGCWVAQLARGHRALLSRRFVLRDKVDPNEIDQAILAILRLKDMNRRMVAMMRRVA